VNDPLQRWILAATSGRVRALPRAGRPGAIGTARLLRDGVTARRVVRSNSHVLSDASDAASGAYHPQVELALPDGRRTRFTDGVGSLPAGYRVEDTVSVLYPAGHPERARIRAWKRLWLAPLLLCAAGAAPLAAYVGWLLTGQRRGVLP
jgi:hypothetical protein